MTYTVDRNGQRFGPFAHDQVLQYLTQGSLLPSDQAWCAEQQRWLALAELLPPPILRASSVKKDQSGRKVFLFIAECVGFAVFAVILEQIPWSSLMNYVSQGAAVAATGISDSRSPAAQAPREGLPTRVGECTVATIESVRPRIDGVPDSGSSVTYENGGVQVGYTVEPNIEKSRPGDQVRMCLLSIEQDCPKDRHPGHEYRSTNLRTQLSWTKPDQTHSCLGA